MTSSNVYFRNFDQLESEGQLDESIKAEFPQATEELSDGVSRRRWLQIMGASLALGTAAGCRGKQQFIAPYTHRPKNRMPGIPVQYATTMDVRGVGRPLLATSYDGRPIKLDGNADFAGEGGGSDVHVQATVLELYDPDRSRNPVKVDGGKSVDMTWDDLQHDVGHWFEASDGSGIAFLVEPTTSPSFERLQNAVQKKYPQSKWFEYTSLNDDNSRAGIKKASGNVLTPVYQLDRAKVIVSVDADMLGSDPMAVANSKMWSEGRDADHQKMSRLYVVESCFSPTGAMADHRIALRPSKVTAFLAALAGEVKERMGDNSAPIAAEGDADRSTRVLQAMAHDLVANKGAGCVAVGNAHPEDAHALAYQINHMLGNYAADGAVKLVKPVGQDRDSLSTQVAEFAQAVPGIEKLVIIGGNPVYDAPSQLGLGEAIASVEDSVHFSVYRNETSRKCKLHGNLAHPLEAWGDTRAFDGTFCIAQPLIAPLHGGKSVLEVMSWLATLEHVHHEDKTASQAALAFVAGEKKQVVPGEEFVRETARPFIAGDFEKGWKEVVHKGFIEGTDQFQPLPSGSPANVEMATGDWTAQWDGGEVEIRFVPCKKLFDGRYANSGWLHELPDSISKLTWENAAVVNPKTADKLDLKQNRLANLEVNGDSVQLPVFKVPGVPDGVVELALGYGRTAVGRVGGDEEKGIAARGVDVGSLRSEGDGWYWRAGVEVIGSRTQHVLPTTQEHFDMLGEFGQTEINRRIPELIREGSYDSYLEFMEHQAEHEGNGHARNGKLSSMITPVVYRKDESDSDTKSDEGEDHDESEGHDDDHGHHDSWPAAKHHHFENKSLGPGFLRNLPPSEYGYKDSPKWGMSIDLNDCTGCGACTIACQAENNIPIVGPEQVKKGRELHWIRVDRYFRTGSEDDIENAEVVYQPVNCQQCENAPCETVCPVAATVHSDDGLNDMVYNRCIGTRYCGNNCPYKVRRFNYLNFSDDVTLTNQFVKLYHGAVELSPADRALQAMVRNPDVTVRSRGVMEKCTFCTQRIQHAKIAAKSSIGKNNEIPANSIKTACQEACPTNAIVFGDLSNEKSDVTKMHVNKRSYVLLEELNNHPRLKYLARVRNPHPALVHEEEASH